MWTEEHSTALRLLKDGKAGDDQITRVSRYLPILEREGAIEFKAGNDGTGWYRTAKGDLLLKKYGSGK